MANQRAKIAIFAAVVLLAFALIVGLVVHRSLTRDWKCESRQELYYEDPITGDGSCLQSKVQGPCGNNMVLGLDRRNASHGVGVCECDVNHFDRTMIYHEESKQCYFVFTKAFCEDGEWLTVDKAKGAFCETRACDERPLDEPELVPIKEKVDGPLLEYKVRCVELGKSDNVTCNKSQTIKFFKKKLHPACIYLGQSTASVGVPSHGCPAGHFSTGAGTCQPDWDFD